MIEMLNRGLMSPERTIIKTKYENLSMILSLKYEPQPNYKEFVTQ